MGQSNLDQRFKSALEHHPTPINTDLVWAGIQKKQSNTFYKKLAIGIVSLSIIALSTFVFLNKNHSDNYTSGHSDTVPNKKNLEIKDINSAETSLTTISDLQSSSSQNLNSTAHENLNRQNENEKKLMFSDRTENIEKNHSIETNPKKENLKTIRLAENNSVSSLNIEKEAQLGNRLDQKEFIRSLDEEETKNTLPTSQIIRNDIAIKSEQQIRNISSLSNISILNKVAYLNIDNEKSTFGKTLPAFERCFRNNKKSIECYEHGRRTNPIYLQTYAILDYIIQSNSSIEFGESYTSLRDSTQSYQISQRAGIQLKYLFDNGLFFKSGIEHAISREKFKLTDVETTWSIEPNQIIAFDIDMNGDTTKTFGNAPVKTEKIKRWDINNSYSSLGIPFIVGYQTRIGNLTYSIEAGTIYNLSYKFDGWLISSAKKPEEGINYFKNKTNLSLTGGVNAIYKLNEKLNSFVTLSLRRNMSYTNNPDVNSLNQKNLHIGIGIGMEWRLTK